MSGEIPALAVDATGLYWTSLSEGSENTVNRLPTEGGTPVVLAQSPVPAGLALDDDAVYWTDFDHGVLKVPKIGGELTALAGFGNQFYVHLPTTVAVDETGV